MEDREPFGDLTLVDLPGCAMREDVAAIRTLQAAIRAAGPSTGELPAAVGLLDLCPEAVKERSAGAVPALP